MQVNQEYLRDKLFKEVRKEGSQKQWAIKHGVSTSFLNDSVSGRKDICGKILLALGFKKVVVYEELG